MRLTGDTLISDLYDDELLHAVKPNRKPLENHKYIKREWKDGRWVYTYPTDTTGPRAKPNIMRLENHTPSGVKQNHVDNARNSVSRVMDQPAGDNSATKFKALIGKAANAISSKSNEIEKGLNNAVDNAKKAINKFFNDPNNVYDMTSSTYSEKMEQVKETKEWKNIVAKSDPEYTKINEDGTKTYLIDDYVVDKKHPVIDILGDITAGREIDIHEITAESTMAGLKDYAMGFLRSGMLAVGAVSTFLNEKFKFQQGSYDDDIEELSRTAQQGADYVKNAIGEVTEPSRSAIENVATLLAKSADAATNVGTLNEGDVIRAAQIILESETVQKAVGNNEYYKMAESALSGLSDEELTALKLLLQQLRGQ